MKSVINNTGVGRLEITNVMFYNGARTSHVRLTTVTPSTVICACYTDDGFYALSSEVNSGGTNRRCPIINLGPFLCTAGTGAQEAQHFKQKNMIFYDY